MATVAVNCGQNEELNSTRLPADEVVKEQEVTHQLRVEHSENGHVKVLWRVDAKKLRSKDAQIVSPDFAISPGRMFKLLLKPRHPGSFKKARGCGSVALKSVGGPASTLC